jgi:hypothetical protein
MFPLKLGLVYPFYWLSFVEQKFLISLKSNINLFFCGFCLMSKNSLPSFKSWKWNLFVLKVKFCILLIGIWFILSLFWSVRYRVRFILYVAFQLLHDLLKRYSPPNYLCTFLPFCFRFSKIYCVWFVLFFLIHQWNIWVGKYLFQKSFKQEFNFCYSYRTTWDIYFFLSAFWWFGMLGKAISHEPYGSLQTLDGHTRNASFYFLCGSFLKVLYIVSRMR